MLRAFDLGTRWRTFSSMSWMDRLGRPLALAAAAARSPRCQFAQLENHASGALGPRPPEIVAAAGDWPRGLCALIKKFLGKSLTRTLPSAIFI